MSIPFLKIDKRSTPEGITDKELHALLRTAGQSPHGLGKRNYALIQLLVQTGLSVSEVANVKRGDITIYQRSGSIRICRTKKYKARRIPLNATVRRAITAYLNASPDRTPNDRLFLTKRKTPISVRTLQATITKLVSRAKISRIKVTARTLRQTFIINYLKKHPGEYKTLVKLLGLKSLDMLIVYIRARKQYDSATSQISRPASYV